MAMAALASYVVGLLFYHYGVHCPRCAGNIGSHTNYFGLRKTWFFRAVNFCPFCGVHLDQSLEPGPRAGTERSL